MDVTKQFDGNRQEADVQDAQANAQRMYKDTCAAYG